MLPLESEPWTQEGLSGSGWWGWVMCSHSCYWKRWLLISLLNNVNYKWLILSVMHNDFATWSLSLYNDNKSKRFYWSLISGRRFWKQKGALGRRQWLPASIPKKELTGNLWDWGSCGKWVHVYACVCGGVVNRDANNKPTTSDQNLLPQQNFMGKYLFPVWGLDRDEQLDNSYWWWL